MRKSTAVEYLDKLNDRGLHDAEIARRASISRSAISNARKRSDSTFDDSTAIEIADLLKIPRLLVISDMRRNRTAENRATKSFWEAVFQRESKKLLDSAS